MLLTLEMLLYTLHSVLVQVIVQDKEQWRAGTSKSSQEVSFYTCKASIILLILQTQWAEICTNPNRNRGLFTVIYFLPSLFGVLL